MSQLMWRPKNDDDSVFTFFTIFQNKTQNWRDFATIKCIRHRRNDEKSFINSSRGRNRVSTNSAVQCTIWIIAKNGIVYFHHVNFSIYSAKLVLEQNCCLCCGCEVVWTVSADYSEGQMRFWIRFVQTRATLSSSGRRRARATMKDKYA